MHKLFLCALLLFFITGCDQFNKDAKAEQERKEERAKAKAKQDKIDKAVTDLNRQIKDKKLAFEKTVVESIKTKDGKKSFADVEVIEWSPLKLHLYSKDGGLDVVSFTSLTPETQEELGYDKKLAKLYTSFLKYKKRNTFSGGSASDNYDPNRKKTDAELRKDAEAATTERRIDYTFYTLKSLGNGDYSLHLQLAKVSTSGIARIIGVFNGTVKNGIKAFKLGSNKPNISAKSYGRFKNSMTFKDFQLTLYTGDGKYFLSRQEAVESRYAALKFRNK
ncbi:MAG: hypothetical protein NE334_16150 [Lentisphaeraceae bacterium]|nr:hypothetical protein [Lentisphaeraceae bacterium]